MQAALPASFRNTLLCLFSSAFFSFLATYRAGAAYYDLIPGTNDPKQAIECLTYDTRQPYWTKQIYFATYPHHAITKEGWEAPYYGGVQPNELANGEKTTGILYSAWQMAGKDHPTSGISFAHAGKGMGWHYSNWEGSAGGISGQWSPDDFKMNQWYRFVHRVWLPASHRPHTGYAGVWMQSVETGRWFHLATIEFPGELLGFANLAGFIEAYGGESSEKSAVEFRNCYSMRQGKWNSESGFSARNGGNNTITLAPGQDGGGAFLECTLNPKDSATKKRTSGPVKPEKLTLKQPDQPDFLMGKAWVDAPSAECLGNQVVVRWKMDDRSTPQLGYIVKAYVGQACVATAEENEPEVRQCTLTLPRPSSGRILIGISIRDIFGRTTREARFVSVPSDPLKPVAKLEMFQAWVPGLTYSYYETAKPADWTALPDFTQLKPKQTGVVATPDLTPRLARKGYAFVFDGSLRVPADGIYTFDMVVASGGKLAIGGRTVIDADGDRSIAPYSGSIALKAGLHPVNVSYYHGAAPRGHQADDFLELLWAGPGLARTSVPAAAFYHAAKGQQPVLTAKARMVDAATLEFTSHIEGAKAMRVAYYAVNDQFSFFTEQGANRLDYFLGETKNAEGTMTAPIWGGSRKIIRARALLEDGRTLDSVPIAVQALGTAPAADANGMKLTELEYHVYPATHAVQNNTVTLVGDSMTLLTRPHKGDVTLIARLADILRDQRMADGSFADSGSNYYFSGIILRNSLAPRPGEPLGGSEIPYIAVMVNAAGKILHCDSTMINGAGNQPAAAGKAGASPWFKLTRKGQTLSSFISEDGKDWKPVTTISLPGTSLTGNYKIPALGDEIEIGFVQYSLPNSTPLIQWSKFDHLSITGEAK
jgi:hypothetical protein